MKCNIEWLSAYLDGALAEDKRAKLEEHLKTCDACGAKLEEFARVEQAAKKIPAPQLSEAYWENFANRVQNKLTIREKQRTSAGWLEALKSFFQPTTGRLAIAGSVAVILLLTFISLDQWKKQIFRPPVFEAEKPVVEEKIDSVLEPAKDESAFRTAEKDNKVGLVEDKRLDQPARERGTAKLSQKPADNAPAASAPVGRVFVALEEQKPKEEPSLAAFAERDEGIEGDTVVVTTGKKAEIRKEATTSQVKISAEEIKKLPIRSPGGERLEVGTGVLKKDSESASTKEGGQLVQGDTLTVIAPRRAEIRKITTTTPLAKAAPQNPSTARSLMTMPAIDTIQLVSDIRQIIAEKESQLKGDLSKTETESLYIYLAQYYVQLYRFSLVQDDLKKADQRIADFLKTDLSESAHKWLMAIQTELKKLKK